MSGYSAYLVGVPIYAIFVLQLFVLLSKLKAHRARGSAAQHEEQLGIIGLDFGTDHLGALEEVEEELKKEFTSLALTPDDFGAEGSVPDGGVWTPPKLKRLRGTDLRVYRTVDQRMGFLFETEFPCSIRTLSTLYPILLKEVQQCLGKLVMTSDDSTSQMWYIEVAGIFPLSSRNSTLVVLKKKRTEQEFRLYAKSIRDRRAFLSSHRSKRINVKLFSLAATEFKQGEDRHTRFVAVLSMERIPGVFMGRIIRELVENSASYIVDKVISLLKLEDNGVSSSPGANTEGMGLLRAQSIKSICREVLFKADTLLVVKRISWTIIMLFLFYIVGRRFRRGS